MLSDNKTRHYNIDLSKSFGDIAYQLEDHPPTNQGYHYHEGYEIMQMWSDSGHVLIEDKIYPIAYGHIYIINALESHCTNPHPSTPYVRSKITFSASYINKLLEHIGQTDILDPFRNKNKSIPHYIAPNPMMINQFDELFSRIATENSTGVAGSSALINAYLVEMLVLVYRYYLNDMQEPNTQISSINSHFKRTIEYINENLYHDITIDMLCDKLHLSKYYLCHLFKKISGVTVMQYILERRISDAKKILTLTDESISDIAIKTGFSSFSLFSRTFRRITGYSPLCYRKKFHAVL